MSTEIVVDSSEQDSTNQHSEELNEQSTSENPQSIETYSTSLPSLNAIRCAAAELDGTHTSAPIFTEHLPDPQTHYGEFAQAEELGTDRKEDDPKSSLLSVPPSFSGSDSLTSVLMSVGPSLITHSQLTGCTPNILHSDNEAGDFTGVKSGLDESEALSSGGSYKTPITQAQRQKEYRKRKREERELERQRVQDLEDELTKVKRQREHLLEERHRNDFWKILGENLRLLLQELPPVSPFRADLIHLLGRGLKCKDLSKNLNIPESTVRSALNKTNIQLTKIKYPLKVTRNRKSKKDNEPNSPNDESPPGLETMSSSHFISGPLSASSLANQLNSTSGLLGNPLTGAIISSIVPSLSVPPGLNSTSMNYLGNTHGLLSMNPLAVLGGNGEPGTVATSSSSLLGPVQSNYSSSPNSVSALSQNPNSSAPVPTGSPSGIHHHHHHHVLHPHSHGHHQPHSPLQHSHLQLLSHHHQMNQHSRGIGERDPDEN